MFKSLKKIYNPSVFQGNLKNQKYFEGWYFKLVTPDGKKFAFIPGVSLAKGDSHCFIQYIDGNSNITKYLRFDISEFKADNSKFDIRIGNNHFSEDLIELHIDENDLVIKGRIEFDSLTKLQSTVLSPGIMGWYSYVPFMECYHGVVSLNHHLNGSLSINSEIVDFSNGNGYTEKDWGHSFPSSWIWIQSNNFAGRIKCFMFSLAKIPWLKGEFDGFISIIALNGKQLRFATYTNARVDQIEIEKNRVFIKFSDKEYQVDVIVERENTVILKAPVMGEMSRNMHESLNSIVHLRIRNLKTNEILEDSGQYAGCELVGNIIENFNIKDKK